MKKADFELKLLKAASGSIFVAKDLEEKKYLEQLCKKELLKEVLPQIYYKPYKRKKEISIEEALKIAKAFLQKKYPKYHIAHRETAAYLLGYRGQELTKISYYVPNMEHTVYMIGKYEFHLIRKDKKSNIYALKKLAMIIELYRFLQKKIIHEMRKEELQKLVKKKYIAILLKGKEAPKWIQEETRKKFFKL